MLVEISCPSCQQGKIQMDPQLLAAGAAFACDTCGAKVSVTSQSQAELQAGVEKYMEYQKDISNIQSEGNNPLDDSKN